MALYAKIVPGDDRFYETSVPLAGRLYDAYLHELRQEGLIE